ncbi:hypothetical protein BABINDRAFT_167996 [Babjeviella inositovora NRRL Y-12698]|uniref:mRNA-capping enzyme subunit beta n=1 Tax=Babjeviella inositovora NRRL Y-12698 TaxID=984486 RepID=A0A1E3QM89_9ASCO|nr:uncharacterized protein BABINDRAFT_167996 [Babjeviella inositovora NRRL Y-12698]ODQ78816.1 hypothetical protein BABINDRAFT_167996 [Babjeviella inositovora NRRL Y-12698]
MNVSDLVSTGTPQSTGSSPPASSPGVAVPKLTKRTSVANLMNEKDVDINGVETLNRTRSTGENRPSTTEERESESETDGQSDGDSDNGKAEDSVREPSSLSVKPSKPRRYQNVPVWAQDWTAPGDTKPATHTARNANTFYAPSITGTVPYEDLTRRVSTWVYAVLLKSIQKSDYKYIELEFKLGRIIHKETDKRISVPVTTESAINPDNKDFVFVPGVEQHMYQSLGKFIEDLMHPHDAQRKAQKFKTIALRIVDYSYNVGAARENQGIPRRVRVSKDSKTGRETAIEKLRISDLWLSLPNELVDLKISLSLEKPVENDDQLQKLQATNRPVNIRIKARDSYIHPATCCQIDMTRIIDGKDKLKPPTFEVECELMTPELLDRHRKLIHEAENGVVNGDAGIAYEELIRCFVDNGRAIARQFLR